MTTHETLVAARNYIDRWGWTQQGVDGRRVSSGTCAFLAPSFVGADDPLAVMDADAVLLEQLGLWDLCQGYAWNDAPDRTKAEVLDLFDRAIAATAPQPLFDQLDANPASSASESPKEGVPA